MPAELNYKAFLDGCGSEVQPSDLSVARAHDLAAFLGGRDDVGVQLVAARQEPAGRSWLVLRVEVDVGQQPVVDIRREEDIAIGFGNLDCDWPQVRALRTSFPRQVSHLFAQPDDGPAALCLSEERWAEARRRWSAGRFVRLLRRWLIETARGELHGHDQALEPFLAAHGGRVILPADLSLAEGGSATVLRGRLVSRPEDPDTVYRLYPPGRAPAETSALLAAAFRLPTRVHGAMRHARTLADLRELLGSEVFDFANAFDRVIRNWITDGGHSARAMLLIEVPLARREGTDAERCDHYVFLFAGAVRDIAKSLDLWTEEGGGLPVPENLRQPQCDGRSMAICALNPHIELTPALAAAYNGYEQPTDKALVAVGAGALGSQVISNLLHAGETLRAVIDEDRLLPHNLSRHAEVDHQRLGHPKADGVAAASLGIFPDHAPPVAVMADVLTPSEELRVTVAGHLAAADIILDMAAAVSVSRALDLDFHSTARRMSAFLSPNGRDLIILAEDAARERRLEHLEMNYYAALAAEPELEGHMALPPGVRYARSCREVSVRLPQSAVALHAAIAAESLRTAALDPAAFAAVWRQDPDTLAVRRITIDTRSHHELKAGSWTVLLSQGLIERLLVERSTRLPLETGGVLVGDIDVSRRRVYLATAIPCPGDSEEQATSFRRGAFGLDSELDAIRARTHGMLTYRGEWHSHPDWAGVRPSRLDIGLQAWMAEALAADGEPAVMLIAGHDKVGCLVGDTFSVLDLQRAT